MRDPQRLQDFYEIVVTDEWKFLIKEMEQKVEEKRKATISGAQGFTDAELRYETGKCQGFMDAISYLQTQAEKAKTQVKGR